MNSWRSYQGIAPILGDRVYATHCHPDQHWKDGQPNGYRLPTDRQGAVCEAPNKTDDEIRGFASLAPDPSI
jgi:hypothetical protein